MALTVKELKQMLSLKRDEDIVSINDMVIEYAELNNEHDIPKTINITIYSLGELSADNIRKARLRAAGIKVL